MTDPLRSSSPADGTEIVSGAQFDPTLAPSPDRHLTPPRKPEPEPDFGPPEKPGEVGTLGRYRVLKGIGRGGMGAVYLSYDTVLGRRIALKVLLPHQAEDAEARERFLREARAAAKVKSDHVVTIYDVGEERGIPFIAMEYLLGYPLDQFLRVTGELPVAQIFRVARETALGLSAAHELGLIHRDVKPGNIWLEAPHGRVKLLDFGLARAADDDTHLTSSGLVVGTPAFMSPEQARGERLDARSDLFSLGVMLYRLTTGKLPFAGTTTMAVLTALAVHTPPPVRAANPDVPRGLELVISKLLAKDPAERYQTAWEVVTALRAAEAPAAGQLPVVVSVTPMAIPVQTENVWEGIEASGSSPRVLEPGTDPAASPASARRKPERKPPVLPLVLAGAVLLLAVAGLAAVLLLTQKGREKDPAAQTAPSNEKRPPAVRAAPDPERRAAEYALSVGATVQVNGGPADLVAPAALPRGPFALTRVNFAGNPAVTDAGLANFKGCANLTYLDLGAPRVTDAGLANFRDCKGLQTLSLHGADVTDAGLAFLKDCPNLSHVRLSGTKATDAGLTAFEGCQNLTILNLNRTAVTDVGLVHVRGCKRLVALDLGGTRVTDAGLAAFAGCEGLTDVSLSETAVDGTGLAALKGARAIAALVLADTRVTDATIGHVADHKALGYLDLSGTGVTDEGLKRFAGRKSLTTLLLRRTGVTAKGVAELAKTLPGCKIEWDGGTIEPGPDPERKAAERVFALGGRVRVNGVERDLQAPAELPPRGRFVVTRVSFTGNQKVTDADLAVLKDCDALARVALGRTGIGDAGLAHLKDRPTLTRLDLMGTRVTDSGLANLAGCTGLTTLWLNGTRVTDAGLAHLKGCKGLTDLDARGTRATAAGVAELAKALPGCKIVWDGGRVDPRPVGDPDRKAAEYTLSVGGVVRVESGGREREVKDPADLPKGPFALTLLNVSRNPKVTDEGLAAARGCKNLKFLYLNQSPGLTDAGMEHFAGITSLTHFEVYGTAVTDEGLAYFKDCKNLLVLGLGQMPMTDEGLAHFKDCKSLTYLAVSHSPVTDEGLAHFKDCKGMGHLDLRNTKVTDAALEQCKGYPDLTRLFVQKTPTSPVKVEEVAAALPRCRIEHDGGVIEPKKE